MKKVLIGLVAGTMAIGGASPVAAGGPNENDQMDESIWEILDTGAYSFLLTDLILIAGYAGQLDDCGNGKPQYTIFAPYDEDISGLFGGAGNGELGDGLDDFLDDLGVTIADLQSSPTVVKGIINDHLVNGAFSPWQLDLDEITTLTTRSGFTLRNDNGEYINDIDIEFSEQACNGWIYFIDGVIDSTPQVPTEGLNAQDSPTDGTPGGSNSLPDTI